MDAIIPEEVSALQLVEQKRACFALEKVKLHMNKEFRSYVRRMPAMIQRNGLGQAAAFYRSKAGDEHISVYRVLSEWLCEPDAVYAGSDDLLAGITSMDMHAYRRAEAEAVALLIWLKRFADAMCPEEGIQIGDEEG